ncbi:MAG TPA: Hsp20/alpha crystallin family protein [Candidatus Deferrimicrobium sp.]|nr:Hsp20/alpha crystallin family protein [Candidatus Deferrimicrobium sp.]
MHHRDMFGECGFRFPHDHTWGPHMREKMFHRARRFWPYSLKATDTEYIIEMPLPGLDVADIKVSVKKNKVFIETHREKPIKEEGKEAPQLIRSFGGFFWKKPRVATVIRVDDEINPDTVKAKLLRGILTVTLARTPGNKINVEE